LEEKVAELAADKVGEAYRITDKVARKEALGVAKDAVIEALSSELAEGETLDKQEVGKVFGSLEKKIVRGRIAAGEKRIDG
ncbi:polyribonucleotide nucleotidyltransferase, partial [Cobetia sp. SIMBA_158]